MNLAELLKDSAYKLTPEEAVLQLYAMVLRDDHSYLAREGSMT